MSERWQRLLADFEAAAAMGEPERQRFLAARRADDPDAAAELERLLAADTGSGVLDSDPQRLLGELGLAEHGLAGEPSADADVAPTIGGVAPSPAAAVPAVIGRYQVLERIGRGGFGDVYRGFDPVLKRAVAIKTCLAAEPSVRERFVREAELAARLVHPNIVTIHDFGADGEVPYLVQELLPGEDLAQRLGRRGGTRGTTDGEELSLGDKLRLLLDVAAGLAHAHAAGIVHRDVKPGNLRLLPDGRVKILDFGIARELGAGSVLTGDERAIGTLAYMAPEQARGELPDARADVHGWGAVAYELLSGSRAVPGDSPAALIFRLLDTAPPPLRQVAPSTPPELAALVDRCLERDPANRPRDGAELLALLEPMARRLVPAEELRTPVAAWGTRSTKRPSDWRRWAAIAAVVAAAVLATRMAMRSDVDVGSSAASARSGSEGDRNPGAHRPTSGNAASTGATGAAGPNAETAAGSAAPGPLAPPAGTALSPTSSLPPAANPAATLGTPTTSPPAAAPAAAPLATGTLQIDARPWGQLVRLVASDGGELRLPDDAITPLALAVPAGDYTAWLRHPQGGERSCEARVEAGGRALCRAELRELRAAELLGGGSS